VVFPWDNRIMKYLNYSKGIRVSREDILKLEPGCRDDFIADFKASELFRMNGGLK
jgi:hypothetical protein